jgi:hypothetical protein
MISAFLITAAEGSVTVPPIDPPSAAASAEMAKNEPATSNSAIKALKNTASPLFVLDLWNKNHLILRLKNFIVKQKNVPRQEAA